MGNHHNNHKDHHNRTKNGRVVVTAASSCCHGAYCCICCRNIFLYHTTFRRCGVADGDDESHTTANTTVQQVVRHYRKSQQWLAGYLVTIVWPEDNDDDHDVVDSRIHGVTFVLPGALVRLTEYESIVKILVEEKRHVVIMFFINVLWTSHDLFAEGVLEIWNEFSQQQEFPYGISKLPSYFSVVGHSVGGKIALLVAARIASLVSSSSQPPPPPQHDDDSNNNNKVSRVSNDPVLPQVKLILALDPVDESPPQFTNYDNPSKNITLEHTTATIYITWATATPSNKIDPIHNAQAIYTANQTYLKPLIRHDHAGHFAYTDHGGGLAGRFIQAGTPQGNQAAWKDVHEQIRRLF